MPLAAACAPIFIIALMVSCMCVGLQHRYCEGDRVHPRQRYTGATQEALQANSCSSQHYGLTLYLWGAVFLWGGGPLTSMGCCCLLAMPCACFYIWCMGGLRAGTQHTHTHTHNTHTHTTSDSLPCNLDSPPLEGWRYGSHTEGAEESTPTSRRLRSDLPISPALQDC